MGQDVLCTVLPYKASIPMDSPHGGLRNTHILDNCVYAYCSVEYRERLFFYIGGGQ